MFSSCIWCLHVLQGSSKVSGLQDIVIINIHFCSHESLVPPSCWRGAAWCLDAHLRLREPQQAEGPKLSQPSCSSSTGFWGDARAVVTPARGADCCYESSPRGFSGTASPLRIHDQIVFVTASSYGRCPVLQRIMCCEKQVWCSISLSSSPLESLENNFYKPHPEWLWIFTYQCFAFI